jgi:hypothetical protein
MASQDKNMVVSRSKRTVRAAGALCALALLVVAPASAQEQPVTCPTPGDTAACRIQVGQPSTLHLVLRTRGKPGAVLRVYDPDGVLLGEATAQGMQDPVLNLAAPVPGAYLARDEGADRAQNAPPIELAVDFAGRATTDGSPLAPVDSSAAFTTPPPPDLPYYVPNSMGSLSLLNVDPTPGTRLRHPLCEMIQSIGGASSSCPPGRSLINADVAADFNPGYTLVVIALLDRDDTPAVPAADPDGGLGGEDSRTALAYVTEPGTVHVATDTLPLYHGTAPRTTRLRVRLCEFPHTIDGVFQLGACHAEAASDPYPVAPWNETTQPSPPPGH